MKVYFVRHGESVQGSQKLHQRFDSPLSEEGKRQAEFVAKRLEKVNLDLIYASPFARAWETAEIINKNRNLPIEKIESMQEVKRASAIEGLPTTHELPLKIARLSEQNKNNPDWKYEDSETVRDIWERTKAAKNHLVHKHNTQNILVVSHGVVIRTFVAMALFGEELNPDIYHVFQQSVYIHNTSVSCLEYEDEFGWRLVFWNDVTHLEDPTF